MRKKTWGLLALTAAAIAFAAARRAPAGDPLPPEDDRPIDPLVARAVRRVYPALVQVYVVATAFQGGREHRGIGAGSGAIISEDGLVVTNHHVAGDATALRCVLQNKEELDAKLVGTDALADIAVIKLDLSRRKPGSPPLPIARWGRSGSLRVGDIVLAMGCPLALSQSVTKGIVTNVDMMMPVLFEEEFKLDGEDVGSIVKWIGHDAMIMPGNSGGPLVSLEGEIVGVNEIGLGNMSGAIPSDVAQSVAKELIARGKVRRSWIGAEFQPVLKTREGWGVLVGGVIAGSPAEQAGLAPGDVVLALNGEPVRARFREEIPAFNLLVLSQPIGGTVRLLVARGKEHKELSVTTVVRDDAQGREVEAKEWGITARELTIPVVKEMQRADRRGVLVTGLRPGGPCDKANPKLAEHDVIVEVAGRSVENLAAFEKTTAAICEGKEAPAPVVVVFEREAERFATLVEVGIRAPQEPATEAKKPWLPVATQVLSKKLAAALGLPGKKGVRISQVYPESSAEQAGLKVGDVVTHLDGALVDASEPQDQEVFAEMIRSYKVGAKTELTLIRDGKTQKLTIPLGEAPKSERELKVYEDQSLELKARDLGYLDRVKRRWPKDEDGALVIEVASGGWASLARLHVDDVIKSVDGEPVHDAKDLERLLGPVGKKKPRHVALLVKRGIHTLFVEIEPSWEKAR